MEIKKQISTFRKLYGVSQFKTVLKIKLVYHSLCYIYIYVESKRRTIKKKAPHNYSMGKKLVWLTRTHTLFFIRAHFSLSQSSSSDVLSNLIFCHLYASAYIQHIFTQIQRIACGGFLSRRRRRRPHRKSFVLIDDFTESF